MSIWYRLSRLYWFFSVQFGVDPKSMFRFFCGLPRYIRDLIRFRSGYFGRLEIMPCLHDRYGEGGMINNEYFWQDLLVAKMIFKAKPVRHVDIGSRVDGFVSHIASFREIEVFDVRPIMAQIPGVIFRQADLMKPLEGMNGYCDSLSCLHALEHFGLGRYGDLINPKGFEDALANMACLLKENGVFYLSVPIGIDRVEFNANRVFNHQIIINLANQNSLKLTKVMVIKQGGRVEEFAPDESQLNVLSNQRYTLVIFIFLKR